MKFSTIHPSTRRRPKSEPAAGHRRREVLVVLGTVPFLPALAAPPAAAGRAEEAAAFIRRIADRALAILTDENKTETERVAELERLLEQATDLDLIAKLVLGSYWRKATPEQRRRYLELFRKMIRKQIATNISRYDGQRIEIVGSREIDDRDTMVSTLVHGAEKDPPYRVDWRVRRSNGRHLVIDVVAEGVSLLITKRKEFREIVSSKGIEGLLTAMARKIEDEGDRSSARG